MTNSVNVSGSLRNRLAITLIGGVTLLTALLYFVIRDYATQIAQQSQDSILEASVTSMLDTAVIRDGVVEMDIPYAAFSMLKTATDDRIFYAIYENEQLLSGYKELQLPPIKNGAGTSYRSTLFKGVPVRQALATRSLVSPEGRTHITASVAQTQDNLSVALQRISHTTALYGIGFFSLAVLLSVWVTSATIRPLRRLTDSIARRGPQELSPVAQPVPMEMVPLVSSFNHLMQRLEKSFEQSEDFIAEAAHRVRTPLATVRSQAESTLQRVDKEENRQSLRSMIRAIDESSRAAGQILDHAMITFRANQLEHQELDLVDLVHEIILRLTPVADMKDVALRLSNDSSVKVSGDPILVQNAVRNLLDNALKYSPSESTISVVVRALPRPYIEVGDQGPGFPTEEINTLTNRFARGKNAEGTIGSGLGLTIARDVAHAHGGRLRLGNYPQGGACVTFSF